jgi:hypothetical protein
MLVRKKITYRPDPAVQKFILHWGEMGTRWGTTAPCGRSMRCYFFRRVPAHRGDSRNARSGPLERELNGLPPRRDLNGRLLSEKYLIFSRERL